MTSAKTSGMPLTKEELIKLKHQIESNDYKIVEQGSNRILVIRSEREFPDIVNDLEVMINKFDMRDINQINNAMIIGEAEVVGVSIEAINSLLMRRIEDDEIIATDLEDKLEEPYSTVIFESEDDPLKVIRLGIRVPGKLNDYKPNELKETLFTKMKSFPKDCEIVYLITDNGYVRLNGKEFYNQLSEFLRDNPEKNIDLSENIADTARGNMADYFIGKDEIKKPLEPAYQEQLNKYIEQAAKQDTDSIYDVKEISEIIEQKKDKNADTNKLKGTQIDTEPQITPLTDDELKEHKISEGTADERSEIIGKNEVKDENNRESLIEKEISKVNSEPEPIEPEFLKKFESTSKSTTPTDWPNLNDFVNKLQIKIQRSGLEIIKEVEVSGVDLIVNNQYSTINKIFISYMPKFDLRKAMALDRTLNRFPNQLCVLIGPKSDYDLKIFIVGKNIVLTDLDIILNTDFLINIEEHI